MVEAQGKMQTEKVIAYMIIAGLIGFLIDTIMVLAEKVLLKWRAQKVTLKGMDTRLPVIYLMPEFQMWNKLQASNS